MDTKTEKPALKDVNPGALPIMIRTGTEAFLRLGMPMNKGIRIEAMMRSGKTGVYVLDDIFEDTEQETYGIWITFEFVKYKEDSDLEKYPRYC